MFQATTNSTAARLASGTKPARGLRPAGTPARRPHAASPPTGDRAPERNIGHRPGDRPRRGQAARPGRRPCWRRPGPPSSQFDRCRRPVSPSATTADSRLSTPARKAMVKAAGQQLRQPRDRHVRQGRDGDPAADLAEPAADRLHVQPGQPDQQRSADHRDQEGGRARRPSAQRQDRRQRTGAHRHGRRAGRSLPSGGDGLPGLRSRRPEAPAMARPEEILESDWRR